MSSNLWASYQQAAITFIETFRPRQRRRRTVRSALASRISSDVLILESRILLTVLTIADVFGEKVSEVNIPNGTTGPFWVYGMVYDANGLHWGGRTLSVGTQLRGDPVISNTTLTNGILSTPVTQTLLQDIERSSGQNYPMGFGGAFPYNDGTGLAWLVQSARIASQLTGPIGAGYETLKNGEYLKLPLAYANGAGESDSLNSEIPKINEGPATYFSGNKWKVLETLVIPADGIGYSVANTSVSFQGSIWTSGHYLNENYDNVGQIWKDQNFIPIVHPSGLQVAEFGKLVVHNGSLYGVAFAMVGSAYNTYLVKFDTSGPSLTYAVLNNFGVGQTFYRTDFEAVGTNLLLTVNGILGGEGIASRATNSSVQMAGTNAVFSGAELIGGPGILNEIAAGPNGSTVIQSYNLDGTIKLISYQRHPGAVNSATIAGLPVVANVPATITWASVPDAIGGYEAVIVSNATSAVIKQAVVPNTSWRLPQGLPTGAYSIQIRAIAAAGVKGAWSTAKSWNVVNQGPVITSFDTPVGFTENALPVLLDANVAVVDSDSADLAGGKLTVSITANAQATDRIGIKQTGTAAGQIAISGNNVLYGGVSMGTFAGTTSLVVTLNGSATPLAVQTLLRAVTFSSLSEAPSTLARTVKVTLTDGDGGTSNEPLKTINVTAVNDNPVITGFDSLITYTENGFGVVLDTNVIVTDVDSTDFNTGRLSIKLIANGETPDRLEIRNQGTTAGLIGVNNTSVSYGGTVVGSYAGGLGTTELVVTLNSTATPAAVQALLRNITFRSTSDNPSTLPRTVRVTLTDGDGGTSVQPTKTINVLAVNDAPVIGGISGTVTYTENTVPVLLASTTTVVDVDSANLSGGRLTVGIIGNVQSTDRIGIRHVGTGAGQIGVSGNSVSFGGVTIGTFTGTTSLVVTLNANATPAAVQALVRSVTYSTISDAPVVLDRTVRFTLTDGDGGTSLSPTKIVKVVPANDAPVIGGISGTVTYTENKAPVLLASTATVVDADSANLSGGRLTVGIIGNVQSTDRIAIRHVGTGAGQIGVSGNSVSFGGVTIGTFTGTTSLVVTLNASATPTAVQSLVRSVVFSSISTTPSRLTRTIRVSLTDGDGGTSNQPTKLVSVVGGSGARSAATAGVPSFRVLDSVFESELL